MLPDELMLVEGARLIDPAGETSAIGPPGVPVPFVAKDAPFIRLIPLFPETRIAPGIGSAPLTFIDGNVT